jgi:hypothetical protein
MSRRPQGSVATLAGVSRDGVICLGAGCRVAHGVSPIIGRHPGLLTGFWPLEERSDLHDGGRSYFHRSASKNNP